MNPSTMTGRWATCSAAARCWHCSAGRARRILLAGCAPGDNSTAQPTVTAIQTALTGAPGCVARPALTEGPYFVDERLNRGDIRSDPSDGAVRPGVPLRLTFRVSSVATHSCAALQGAMVDVWRCDALGIYSDVSDPSFNTAGKRFLRGYQVTDANGAATFTTIYPGWYQGRTVHSHFKIRASAGAGASHQFTSQLFFDDSLSDRVFAQAPYNSGGQRTARDNDDGIYRSGGSQLLLNVTKRMRKSCGVAVGNRGYSGAWSW
jgi:protocatechuate 3,4-dioxygenase beta subunit